MAQLPFSDPVRFEQLFRSSFREMCNIVLPILRDESMAKDAVQEVFADLWRKRFDLEIQSNERAYLTRACVNKSLDLLRRKARQQGLRDAMGQMMAQSELTTGQQLDAAELADLIQHGIAKMPPQCAVVFNLSRFQGMKNKEIAAHLGISIKTVENQMGKGLRILREYLGPYLADQGPAVLLLLWAILEM